MSHPPGSDSPWPTYELAGRPDGRLTRRHCLRAAVAGWAWASAAPCARAASGVATPASAAAADRPPALMLARHASPGMDPRGWLVSEKLDGVRAVWQAGRLRFRGGGEVPAPPSFLAQLQRLPADWPLDGELWLAHGRFEELSGLVRRGRNAAAQQADWAAVRYRVFDTPGRPEPFEARWQGLLKHLPDAQAQPQAAVAVLPQTRLDSPQALRQRLNEVLAAGGEGLMLHRATALWQATRSADLLKLKPVQDAEAVVMGYEPGQGRYAGQVGALRVRDAEGREFRIGSGLTDAWRREPPPVGAVVTYRWRGTTNSGLPRFASLWRLRGEGG